MYSYKKLLEPSELRGLYLWKREPTPNEKELLRDSELVMPINKQQETCFTNVGAVICTFVHYRFALLGGKDVSSTWHLYKSMDQALLMSQEDSVFGIPKGLVCSGKYLTFQRQ